MRLGEIRVSMKSGTILTSLGKNEISTNDTENCERGAFTVDGEKVLLPKR